MAQRGAEIRRKVLEFPCGGGGRSTVGSVREEPRGVEEGSDDQKDPNSYCKTKAAFPLLLKYIAPSVILYTLNFFSGCALPFIVFA